jgi:hypothetical protein
VALVDDEDCETVSAYVWSPVQFRGGTFYAQRTTDQRGGKQFMHSLITGWARVDHANGNGLDNRRQNLRQADHSENAANSRPRGGSSPYKGVSWNKNSRAWTAYVVWRGARYYCGTFQDELEAARAYDVKARELHGEFARLNGV